MKPKALVLSAIIFSSLILYSCTHDSLSEPINESRDLIISSEDSVDQSRTRASIKAVALEIVNNLEAVTFDEELVKKNEKDFIEFCQNNTSSKYSLEEVSAILKVNFGVPEESMMKLFSIAYENRDLLVKEGARELLIDEMHLYILELKKEERGIFSFLHAILSDDDTHCSLEVLAHIADAMVYTAIAAITAPTGIGAVVAGIGIVSSAGQAVVAANNCN